MDGDARAYLWIPSDCRRVRGVVFANHNMIEQGILEHPSMRETLARLGFAEVWTVPYFDATFDFNKGAGERFDRLMTALANKSGYEELRHAPVVPLGHSACATFPWNFAAWNPARALAIISVHGDAPRTTLTGNGSPRIEWGDRTIDGIPGLMVMAEYEWWEDRLSPAFAFQAAHPRAPLAFLADAGRGHFDCADPTVEFIARFIEKAAERRLPAAPPTDAPVPLREVDPREGWRIDRWHADAPPSAPAAPYADYTGDPQTAFWCFDAEMAATTEKIYAAGRGKKPQLISVTDGGQPVEKGTGEPVTPRFIPDEDGVTLHLQTAFLDAVPSLNSKATLWTGAPAGSRLGHATEGGPIKLSRIVGPAVQSGPNTFSVRFGRAEHTAHRRNNDIWLVASHPGDGQFKSVVQQAMVHAATNKVGMPQTITFPAIPDQRSGAKSLQLAARSDSGLPVAYYVLEGPAEIEGETLVFSPIPPRAKLPLAVTVVATQFGRGTAPKIQTAKRVERTFLITDR